MGEHMVSIKSIVAVYGSLRMGCHNHYLLKESEFLGQFRTDPEFRMMDLGDFPAIIKNGDTSIVMEVYSVNPKTMAALDFLEGYPQFYNREKISTPYGDAWYYFLAGNAEGYSNVEIRSGDWLEGS
jgi:gamma-glutamylaminecyclotransferase